ncbi:sugar phosphate isomerase/epimerase family protein [Fictibacillus phosphorivorans]|uniref:sugar phosphate isomerase/epimerase family protein n=1 Tax=Fictibacillus phosphorivorans TaxID=1221500 RepID=UPI00203EEF0A|nr:sugar phosphate isomerase/epimerase [Fictibacillus phosphorivorans]MCM3719059.1 sugar phosphate isomerase/epimerase [Fictibacillus phosphorivorans]MCM3776681.1 sugar phosphate isomerase/epimerase [Fictibacillus phosphorivorans]
MRKIGLQLYSIHSEAEKNLLGTLEKVSDMGYDSVQFAGLFGIAAKEVKKVLDATGLTVAGAHIPVEHFSGDALKKQMDDQMTLGNDLMVMPYLTEEQRQSIDDYKRVAETLNEAAFRSKEYGIRVAYHNHDFEFYEVEGKLPFDVIFQETDAELVKMELDTYWVKYAGFEPENLLKTYKGRCVSLHLKDMATKDDKKVSTIVGSGILDMKGFIKLADEEQVDYCVIEQEYFEEDPLSEVEKGVRNLKALL